MKWYDIKRDTIGFTKNKTIDNIVNNLPVLIYANTGELFIMDDTMSRTEIRVVLNESKMYIKYSYIELPK